MSANAKTPSPETTKHVATLAARAMDLDAIFACGGDAKLPAPLALRGPTGKRLVIDEHVVSRSASAEKQLRAWCAPAAFGHGAETRTDPRVRDGHQLYARDGALAVEGLDEALAAILGRVRESLCPFEASPPVASLHSLNVYRRGGHFVAHKDTPRDPGVFGTLVVCLPLPFSGGRLIVEQESRTTYDWEFPSYTPRRSEEALRVRWAAFFGDVDHRIETVTSGCRATLTYELRRAPVAQAMARRDPGAAEAAFTDAIVEALADPAFVARGGKLGLPCLHLYALPTGDAPLPAVDDLRQDLKGRDRLVAEALARAGLEPRVVPYVFEDCAGESWRLRRGANAREKEIFTQKRLERWDLEDTLPIDFHADYQHPDDVTWLVRPPWISAYPKPADGRPEPARELLGEVEYSETGYFGNEAGDAAFYAVAAIVAEVPSASARRRLAATRTAR
jgi:hypothetical protein